MIRLTELKLPLDHTLDDLAALIHKTLGVATADITEWHIFKRSFDARKADVLAVYIVDLTLKNGESEQAILLREAANPHIFPTPDMAYQLVATAPANLPLRPVVVPVLSAVAT